MRSRYIDELASMEVGGKFTRTRALATAGVSRSEESISHGSFGLSELV